MKLSAPATSRNTPASEASPQTDEACWPPYRPRRAWPPSPLGQPTRQRTARGQGPLADRLPSPRLLQVLAVRLQHFGAHRVASSRPCPGRCGLWFFHRWSSQSDFSLVTTDSRVPAPPGYQGRSPISVNLGRGEPRQGRPALRDGPRAQADGASRGIGGRPG